MHLSISGLHIDLNHSPTAITQQLTALAPTSQICAAFESFLVQFQNYATFNKWNKEEQLAFLRGALDKEAAQVLWDYNEE